MSLTARLKNLGIMTTMLFQRTTCGATVLKKWRKVKIEDLHLYEIVATIYSVSPSEIVSYDQINDLKEQPQLVGITEDELKALLNPGPNLEKVNME